MTEAAIGASGLLALADKVTGNALAMAHIARRLRRSGADAEAVELALRASELPDATGEAAMIIAEVLSKGAPRWHFGLVRDRARNAAYQAAIEAAVFPGCTVLEIGAGSGLLSLMAARAGAGRVITCEVDPAIAEVARRNVAANGYADRITVLNRHSTDLDVDRDLGGQADILVSEILSDSLLSEAVLPSHADAMARLVKPGATVIPLRGRVVVALARARRKRERVVSLEEGFDLSAVNLLAKPHRGYPVDSTDIEIVGEPATLFDFSFDQTRYAVGEARIELVSDGRPANGVLQWIAMDMIGDQTFDNRPGTGIPSSWGCLFWPFADERDFAPGERLAVGGRHDTMAYWLWPEG